MCPHVRRDDRTDSLTGLASRGRLERCLERRCHHRLRGDAVILIDIVGVKAVNTSLGFLAGDELIRGVARRLVRLSRDEAVIGRLGGDEFLAIFRPRHAAMAERFAASAMRPGEGPAVRLAVTTIQPRDTARKIIARLDASLRAARARVPLDESRPDRE